MNEKSERARPKAATVTTKVINTKTSSHLLALPHSPKKIKTKRTVRKQMERNNRNGNLWPHALWPKNRKFFSSSFISWMWTCVGLLRCIAMRLSIEHELCQWIIEERTKSANRNSIPWNETKSPSYWFVFDIRLLVFQSFSTTSMLPLLPLLLTSLPSSSGHHRNDFTLKLGLSRVLSVPSHS